MSEPNEAIEVTAPSVDEAIKQALESWAPPKTTSLSRC